MAQEQRSADHQKILRSNHEIPEAVNACAHHLIEIRTHQQPDSPAINSWDGDLTYAQLDALSSRLAHFIKLQGVGPEIFVPICSEKSLWTIVSLLAVLKAGGAFVLLDPSQPLGRLKSIASQTGATFALSSTDQQSNCKTFAKNVFAVNAQSISELEQSSISSSVSPHNAAYVIFTSGSSGVPKGVLIEHSQLSTSSTKPGEAMGFGSKPRVFQFASYAFDACILEIITTLVFGGTVCIPSEDERKNSILDAMRRMEVTCAFLTPSLLSNLDITTVTSLDTLILGGEVIPVSLIQFWAPKLRLILAYGPTECCIICFVSYASQHTADGEIGRPIGVRAWIVKQDDYNTLADPDELGELLLEGPMLARGYLNDVAKTDAQFIHDPAWLPHGDGNHSRLYRTGDLAKYQHDGTICCTGRIDGQVKIRGQRLELAEVEKQLQRCLLEVQDVEIGHVIVEALIPAGLQSSRMLIAFLSVKGLDSIGSLQWDQNDNPLLISSEVERGRFSTLVTKVDGSMRLALPSYAIPSFYIPLSEVPLGISGKADRRRLRKVATQMSSKQLTGFIDSKLGQSSVKAPTTPAERQLQALWADIFATKPMEIDLNDNFLSLGGDSVLAIRLVAAAREGGLNLSVQTILKHPILSDMALVVTQLQEQNEIEVSPFELLDGYQVTSQILCEASKQCSVPKHLIEDIYPCSAMQSGLLSSSMKVPGAYIMQLVYTLPASLDIDKFMRAWDAITLQNAILRTRFFQGDSKLLQAVVREPPSWKVVENESLDSLLAAEKDRKMSLGGRMSWHILLHQTESQEHHLIWVRSYFLFEN
jgi:amino acid adenylation domain-containing protein